MRQVKLDESEKVFYATLAAEYLKLGATLDVTITKTSASNLSYKYKVRLWYFHEITKKVEVMHLSYWLAAELGENLTDSDELRGNGCGFDRAHDAAYTIGRILEARGLITAEMVNAPSYVGNY
jgi:hypothetical protein